MIFSSDHEQVSYKRVWPEETSELLIRSEVVGVAIVTNN